MNTRDRLAAETDLRDRWARKLFHEFITGEQAAWTSDRHLHQHYRAETYRVVDELLAEADAIAAERAAEELEFAARVLTTPLPWVRGLSRSRKAIARRLRSRAAGLTDKDGQR